MQQLDTLIRWGPSGFLFALAVVVFLKLLLGTIPLAGLLTGDHRNGTSNFSLGRAQLLVCTLVVAANYAKQVLANSSLTSLPDLPTGELEVLGGSQFIYLVGKARALWFAPSAPASMKGNN